MKHTKKPKKRILIFGGSGFLGSGLINELVKTGETDIVSASRSMGDVHEGVRETEADITCYGEVVDVVRRLEPDLIFNAAGVLPGIGRDNNDDIMRTNFNGAFNVLQAVRALRSEARIVLVGSAAEYGEKSSDVGLSEDDLCAPTGVYGYSKMLMSVTAKDFRSRFGVDVVVGRIFNIIGPGIGEHNLAGFIMRKYRENVLAGDAGEIRTGDLSAVRDFVDVRDVCRALISIAMTKSAYWLVNISSGKPVSTKELVDEMLALAPVPVKLLVEKDRQRSENPISIWGQNLRLTKELAFDFEYDRKSSVRDMWNHYFATPSSDVL